MISAVLPSMMLAEQYFSCDIWIARATAASASAWPLTLKCMWMRVNTFGSVAARSDVTLTRQPVTSCRPRFKISTTS